MENARGERQRPIRARGTTRASRRGGHKDQARARSASSKTACPTAFSTTRTPVPGDPLIRGRARDSCRQDFHAPTSNNHAPAGGRARPSGSSWRSGSRPGARDRGRARRADRRPRYRSVTKEATKRMLWLRLNATPIGHRQSRRRRRPERLIPARARRRVSARSPVAPCSWPIRGL
jgi:hypothetical protein